MAASLTFVLGLLNAPTPVYASAEDFADMGGMVLRWWQDLGFLATVPERHPVASCPHCWAGVPCRIGEQHLCSSCGSTVQEHSLHRWRFDLDTFLRWLNRLLRLEGEVQPVDDRLWQIGTWQENRLLHECFFYSGGSLSVQASQRLHAYRYIVLLRPLRESPIPPDYVGASVSLVELLHLDGETLQVHELAYVLRGRGAVRFDTVSGVLWVGNAWFGEVPLGSKEYHFLACLSQHLDRFVPYADLKHAVLTNASSADTTEEATFCQRLKNRSKQWIPQLDNLLATTNKGDGYRLRGYIEL